MLGAIRSLDFSNTRYAGEMRNATHIGVAGSPGSGPYVKIWLVVDGSKVLHASYESNGCPTAMASGAVLCRAIAGREVATILDLEATDLIALMGGVAEGKEYCPALAISALRSGLESGAAASLNEESEDN